MSDMLKNLVLWSVILLVLMSVFSNFGPRNPQAVKWSYSEFLENVQNGNVKKVVIEDRNINGRTENDLPFSTYIPSMPEAALNQLVQNGVDVKGRAPEQPSLLMNIFVSWFPIILFIGVWIFFMRQMQGGGGGRGAMSFGRSRARVL
ncbi:MAG: ATP-dependent metalloprotease, partial [Pseudomonadota bacterium]